MDKLINKGLRLPDYNDSMNLDFIAIRFQLLDEECLWVLKNRYGEAGIMENTITPNEGSSVIIDYSKLCEEDRDEMKKELINNLIA